MNGATAANDTVARRVSPSRDQPMSNHLAYSAISMTARRKCQLGENYFSQGHAGACTTHGSANASFSSPNFNKTWASHKLPHTRSFLPRKVMRRPKPEVPTLHVPHASHHRTLSIPSLKRGAPKKTFPHPVPRCRLRQGMLPVDTSRMKKGCCSTSGGLRPRMQRSYNGYRRNALGISRRISLTPQHRRTPPRRNHALRNFHYKAPLRRRPHAPQKLQKNEGKTLGHVAGLRHTPHPQRNHHSSHS